MESEFKKSNMPAELKEWPQLIEDAVRYDQELKYLGQLAENERDSKMKRYIESYVYESKDVGDTIREGVQGRSSYTPSDLKSPPGTLEKERGEKIKDLFKTAKDFTSQFEQGRLIIDKEKVKNWYESLRAKAAEWNPEYPTWAQ